MWGHGRAFSGGRMTSGHSTEVPGESSDNQNQIGMKPTTFKEYGGIQKARQSGVRGAQEYAGCLHGSWSLSRIQNFM